MGLFGLTVLLGVLPAGASTEGVGARLQTYQKIICLYGGV